MREIIKKFNVYKYNELTEEQKKKVLQNLSDINVDYNWYEDEFEYYIEELEKMGFSDVKIYFTGFWNQGDGACFDAKVNTLDILNYLNNPKYNKLKKIADYINITITKYNHHYYHELTRKLEIDFNCYKKYKRINKLINELEKELEELRIFYCKQIYKRLEQQYNYLTSREAIEETLIANEYEFTEDGKIY